MKLFLAIFLAGLFNLNGFAHQAFTLVSSKKLTVDETQLLAVEKERTPGKKDGTNISFTQKDIRLVIVTGPEDDMLSYRILGIRNPTLIVAPGTTLRILIVNRDSDMRHDIRFGHIMGEFAISPELADTAGSQRLEPHDESAAMQAEEIVLKANEKGEYKYFCSVSGHAKGGMWGNILVGVGPGADIKTPVKTEHVHDPNKESMDDMPGMTPEGSKPAETDQSAMHGGHGHGMTMMAVSNVGDPMPRESSGTAWAPDSSPVYAYMKMLEGGGMLMFMGTGYVRYTEIGSNRDVSVAGKGSRARVDAPSMLMAMYSHPVGERAQVGLRGMISLDPIIQRGYGYPLLYQSGEEFRGQPIHDRQHPHDLVDELAVTWSYRLDHNRSVYLYAGYPGEPALGPPTFVHRMSASNNPDAPIGHHWQDSTHISFGVVTGGFSFGKVKLEASAFNGREPDDNRWNFDRPRLTSFSGRVSFNPTKNWALQVSHGYLQDPEPAEPELHILRRTTASAIYNKRFGDDRNWATSVIWGQNYANGEGSNSFLVESNFDFDRNAVFGRLEQVQKSGHDLVLASVLSDELFRVGTYSAGYVRDLTRGRGIDVGIGGMITFNTNTDALTPYYGGTSHTGWQLYLRIRPSKLGH